MNSFLAKSVFFSIIVGLSLILIKLYFYQNDLEIITKNEIFPWYFKLSFIGNIFLTYAAILSFVLYRKYFPPFFTYCYLLMVLLVFVASFESLEALSKRNASFFYSMKGMGNFINMGLIFFAANTNYFPKVLKFFYYSCFVFIVAAFINISKVGVGAGRNEFLLAIRDFTVHLIWVFPYFFLQDEDDKRKNFINLVAFLAIIIFILGINSRSYTILFFIYLGIKFKKQLQTKNGIFVIVGLIILAIGGYFILMNSGLSKTLENAFANMSERGNEDSRSGQLIEFINQWDFNSLLLGVGPLTRWYWTGVNQYYDYLDNQILLMAWWAGLPAVLTYIFFLVKSMLTKSEILDFENIKGVKTIIFFWILACLGFAIYVSPSPEAYYYFILFLIGMNTCCYSQIIDTTDEEFA